MCDRVNKQMGHGLMPVLLRWHVNETHELRYSDDEEKEAKVVPTTIRPSYWMEEASPFNNNIEEEESCKEKSSEEEDTPSK